MEEMLEAAFPVWQFVWQTAGPAESGESYGNHGGGGRHYVVPVPTLFTGA